MAGVELNPGPTTHKTNDKTDEGIEEDFQDEQGDNILTTVKAGNYSNIVGDAN